MKKIFAIILSIMLYFFVWWVLVLISIGLNVAIFKKLTGGITALGGIIAFWLSYKIVKRLSKKYFPH